MTNMTIHFISCIWPSPVLQRYVRGISEHVSQAFPEIISVFPFNQLLSGKNHKTLLTCGSWTKELRQDGVITNPEKPPKTSFCYFSPISSVEWHEAVTLPYIFYSWTVIIQPENLQKKKSKKCLFETSQYMMEGEQERWKTHNSWFMSWHGSRR